MRLPKLASWVYSDLADIRESWSEFVDQLRDPSTLIVTVIAVVLTAVFMALPILTK